MLRDVVLLTVLALLTWPTVAFSQEARPAPPAEVHEHVEVAAPLLTPPREATGTSWLPDTAPMYGMHQPWLGWDVRINGLLFVQALYEPNDRHRTGGFASRQASSVNWAMFMARRNVGDGRIGIRTMLSAEPWTVPGCGSLSFLATGEVCEDDTIHDRQQPHDLFMELAVDYSRPLTTTWRWQVYAGLAGEPALGPPGYPHRASANTNPIAPITHHWLEATRVSFGVVTMGVHNARWKAEWSMFNGRDADDSRVDLDLGGFDSIAARLSFQASERLSLQVSAARLKDARTDLSLGSQDPASRLTASAIYYRPVRSNGLWATTLAYGLNRGREIFWGGVLDGTTAGALLESSLSLSERHTVFGRAEVGGLPGHHLHAHDYSRWIFLLGKLQAGYVRHLRATKGLVPGIGGTIALSLLAPELRPHYSGRIAPTYGVFFSLQAAKHEMP